MVYDSDVLNGLMAFANALHNQTNILKRRCRATVQVWNKFIRVGSNPKKRQNAPTLRVKVPERKLMIKRLSRDIRKIESLILRPVMDLLALMTGSIQYSSSAAAIAVVHRAACGLALFSGWSRKEIYLQFFSENLLALPKELVPSVTEILLTRDWIADCNPLSFVRRKALDLYKENKKGGRSSRTDAMRRTVPIEDANTVSDALSRAFSYNVFADIDAMRDIELILRNRGLPDLVVCECLARYALAPSSPNRYLQEEVAAELERITGERYSVQELEAIRTALKRAHVERSDTGYHRRRNHRRGDGDQ